MEVAGGVLHALACRAACERTVSSYYCQLLAHCSASPHQRAPPVSGRAPSLTHLSSAASTASEACCCCVSASRLKVTSRSCAQGGCAGKEWACVGAASGRALSARAGVAAGALQAAGAHTLAHLCASSYVAGAHKGLAAIQGVLHGDDQRMGCSSQQQQARQQGERVAACCAAHGGGRPAAAWLPVTQRLCAELMRAYVCS